MTKDNWEWVKSFEDDEWFAEHVENGEGADNVPAVLLDFGSKIAGWDATDAYRGLLAIRRELRRSEGGESLSFPRFTYALFRYLENASPEEAEHLA